MNLFGGLVVAAALLAFVGASLHYGYGVRAGAALLPIALLIGAAGIVGLASTSPGLGPLVLGLAMSVAVCAVVLSVLGSLQILEDSRVGPKAERLLRPGFLALLVAIVGFATVGLLTQTVPVVPSVAVAGGTALLAASLPGRERMAEVGFWSSTAGWVGLGVLPWGA